MWPSSSKDSGECSSTCVLMPHLSLGVFLCVVMALFLNFSGEGRQIHVFASGSMLSMRVLRGGGSRILSAEYSGCVACRVCLFLLSKLRTQDSAGVLSPRIVGSEWQLSRQETMCYGLWTATNQGQVSNRTKTRKPLEIYGEWRFGAEGILLSL
jgi:hypothetical protein